MTTDRKLDRSAAFAAAMQCLTVGAAVMVCTADRPGEWRQAVITGQTTDKWPRWIVDGALFDRFTGVQFVDGKSSGKRGFCPLGIWQAAIWRPPVTTCLDCGKDKGARQHLPRCAPCAETHRAAAIEASVQRNRVLAAARKADQAAHAARWEAERPQREAAERDRLKLLEAERAERQKLREAEELTRRNRARDAARIKRNQPARHFTDGFRSGDLIIIGPRIAEVVKVSPEGSVWIASNVDTACYNADYLRAICYPVTPSTLRHIGLLPPHDAGIRGYTYREINDITAGIPVEEVGSQAWKRPAFHAPYVAAVEREARIRDYVCGRLRPPAPPINPAEDEPHQLH